MKRLGLPFIASVAITLALIPRAQATTAEQWAVFETSFTSERKYGNPFMEVQVDVIFQSGEQQWLVPAFWAGGDKWAVRFAPPVQGDYTFQPKCSDPANQPLNAAAQPLRVFPYTGDNPLLKHGFLRISGDKRHFEHADGTPFLWLGDTWWKNLCKRMPWDGFQQLTADRKSKGFNVVQIVCGPYPDENMMEPRWENEGGKPYETIDFSVVNPAYFEHADRRIRHLVDAGMVPVIFGGWGRPQDGGKSTLEQVGLDGFKRHWRNLIARYGAYPTLWAVGGEAKDAYGPWSELAEFVKEIDPLKHPLTADKQNRHCRSAIIENTPARVVIHWRYPCVDVSYKNLKAGQWTDEYYTIHPDGTGVRQVVWNGSNGNYGPAFQDIQILTNPGETALDAVNLQAMDLANLKGETLSLTWDLPNIVPKNTLTDATIERINTKSENKVFAMFQGGFINPWGANEQSKYVVDPFPGMWNHWPMHLVPSDGRFAVATDRVTHFALAANDASNKFGSMVLYGFTRQAVGSLVPLARSWSHPPAITAISGCKADGYRKESRDYPLVAEKGAMSVRIDATEESPLVNPCFTIRNWGHQGTAEVKVTGAEAKDIRQGVITDTDGTNTMVIWLELAAASPLTLGISGAKPPADDVPETH